MSENNTDPTPQTTNPDSAPTMPAAGASAVSDVLNQRLTTESEAIQQRVIKARAQKFVAHYTVAEREIIGKVARAHTDHEELAQWTPPADRADPVELLMGQETSRVQELLPVRHARMAASAFTFYRGAALVMAADLAVMPRSGLDAQLCGDAHLSNFGMFAAPDRSVVFDVNDFDETHPGPFEWDVKRMTTSFILAARDNGMSDEVGRRAATAACASYRLSMADFAGKGELDIWYDRVDIAGLIDQLQGVARDKEISASEAEALAKGKGGKVKRRDKSRGKDKVKDQGGDGATDADLHRAHTALEKSVAKARSRDAWSAIEKLTEEVDGKRQFRHQPPLLTRLDMTTDASALVNSLFSEYRSTLQDDRQELLKRYEIIDLGHKVVGVGSVGLLAFVLLMRGRDETDLMVLQMKEAQSSVLEAFTRKSVYNKHGHRVVTGQRLMQSASDSLLGWIDGPGGRSFYARQLRDMKWSPDPASLTAEKLTRFGVLCGHTLARAHARSADAIAISTYLGSESSFDDAVVEFSMAYADQMALDFAAFKAAIDDGRLVAHEGTVDYQGIPGSVQKATGKTKAQRARDRERARGTKTRTSKSS